MCGRSDVAALVELIVSCQGKLVGNKLQSKRITERIISLLSLPVSHDVDWLVVYALLAKVFGFIAQFMNKAYFASNWMVSADDFGPLYTELDQLIESLGLSIPFLPSERVDDANGDADELVLLVRQILSAPSQYSEKAKKLTEDLCTVEELSDCGKLPTLKTINKDLQCQDMALVGSGKFGIVKKVHLRGVPVAVKPLYSTNPQDAIREALLLQLYDVQGVIRFIGVDDAVRPSCVYLELALCSLRDALFTEQYKGILEQTVSCKLSLLTSLCSIFAHLHSLGITHRDIKSSNILVCSDLSLKVCDFGLSRAQLFVNASGSPPEGTCAYMAPELLMYQEEYHYTQATDMYAFTILMNEVLTERMPFEGMKPHHIVARMYQTEGTIRPELYAGEQAPSVDNVIVSGWHVDAQRRLTFQQLLTHLQMLEAVVCGLESVNSLSTSIAAAVAAVNEGIEVELGVLDDVA